MISKRSSLSQFDGAGVDIEGGIGAGADTGGGIGAGADAGTGIRGEA